MRTFFPSTRLIGLILVASVFLVVADAADAALREGAALRDALVREGAQPIKRSWRPLLLNRAELHGRSILPARGHFKYPY